MPKVYFIDLGLRNSLLNNFENIQERFDKWQFFENVVWREFLFKYWFDKIKYWRNQHQNEIDLIIDEKKAYEVKFSKNLVKESKYKVFRANYPQLNLEFIIFEDFLKFMVENN
jgi:predicted AAA+ superfamily ATPase